MKSSNIKTKLLFFGLQCTRVNVIISGLKEPGNGGRIHSSLLTFTAEMGIMGK